MAAALIVPAGVAVSAQHVGAATPDNVTCTTNTGTMKFNPGVSLTVKHGQKITIPAGTLDGCSGIGITDSTGGVLNLTINSEPVSCKNIKGKVVTGVGHIAWNSDGSNAGIISPVKVQIKFSSLTQIRFTGMVRGHGYLGQSKIKGTATIPPNLRSAGDNGGTCSNSKNNRIKKLDYTNNSDFTIGV
jgi:hypothetical protein